MVSSSVERRLAAIMAMDVVGYSRLMGADEVGTLSALKRHRAELIDPAIAAHHGRVVKTTGDGLLLEFASIVDAIGCAVAIQRGMLSRNAGVPEERRLVFRVGVNIGDIIIDGSDIFGDGVNVAARLEALCEPGGVCISRSANEQVRDKLSIAFADLGEHTVKNIARAIGVYGLAASDIAALPETSVTLAETVSASRRKRIGPGGILAAAAAALAIAGAAWWAVPHLTQTAPQTIEQQLAAALGSSLPASSAKYREDMAAAYARLGRNRAFAVALRAGGSWRSGDWPTRELAEERVLERCQLFFDEPCALLAANEAVMKPAGTGEWVTKDAPRTRYAGLFNLERIPGLRPRDFERPDLAGFATAPAPKAIAIHAQGPVHVAVGAASQRAAEEEALRACNANPVRRETGGPCYLYASENKVVLPLRATAPMTPPPVVAAVAPPPARPVDGPADPASLRAALLKALEAAVPGMAAAERGVQVDGYVGARSQKAMAILPPGNTWRTSNWPTVELAEQRALEGCQVRFGKPCALFALNGAIQPGAAGGTWPTRSMPRAVFDGQVEPDQIPTISEATRKRADVVGYRAMPGPKAIALHPLGRVTVAGGSATQRAAEERALSECNADPERGGHSGPCLLYAVGDQVVLGKRSLRPITAASQ